MLFLLIILVVNTFIRQCVIVFSAVVQTIYSFRSRQRTHSKQRIWNVLLQTLLYFRSRLFHARCFMLCHIIMETLVIYQFFIFEINVKRLFIFKSIQPTLNIPRQKQVLVGSVVHHEYEITNNSNFNLQGMDYSDSSIQCVKTIHLFMLKAHWLTYFSNVACYLDNEQT